MNSSLRFDSGGIVVNFELFLDTVPTVIIGHKN